jgi:hypothetical protein
MKTLFATTFALAISLAIPAFAQVPAVPSKDQGVVVSMSLGCTALDPSAALFSDPTATKKVKITPSGNVKVDCKGRLLADAKKPTATVHFSEKDKAAPVPCVNGMVKYEETIKSDGSFELTCHFHPGKA